MCRMLLLSITFLTTTPPLAQNTGWKADLAANSGWIVPLGVFVGPIIGFILASVVLILGFRYLASIQKKQIQVAREREASLKQREKVVLASSLAGELTGNKVKCESFIAIYSEMMRGLRNPDIPAQYEEGGDMIHQRPSLSRSVFDSNVEKLQMFDPRLARMLADVYANINAEAEYLRLEAGTPRAAAIRMVEMVIDEAQKTLEPLDGIISALNIVVRDGKYSPQK